MAFDEPRLGPNQTERRTKNCLIFWSAQNPIKIKTRPVKFSEVMKRNTKKNYSGLKFSPTCVARSEIAPLKFNLRSQFRKLT